ncbi:hypothetical protein SERLA73DRAFT_63999, partial [Serpula lacrymans var. lacrymans S7.3]
EGEEEFEVKQVVDACLKHGKLEFLVLWKGYGDEDRTWEPKPIWTIPAMLFANFILRIPQLLGSLEAWIQIFLIPFSNYAQKFYHYLWYLVEPGSRALEGR